MTTYSQHEDSLDQGEPLELYRVTYGDQIITLCSGDVTVTHAGEVYTPDTLKRNELAQTQEMSKSVLTVTTYKNSAIAELFRLGTPQFTVFITVFRQHTGVTDADFITAYKGRITSCRFVKFEAELNCEPIFTSLKRPGLRIKYEPTCVNGLYDPGCTLNKEAFRVNGTVSSVGSQKELYIAAAVGVASGYFIGGILSLNGLHMISDHDSTTGKITLIRAVLGVVVGGILVDVAAGDVVALYPGCDHSRTTCHARFNNIVNYKGFPWMSDRNPFTDNTINYIN